MADELRTSAQAGDPLVASVAATVAEGETVVGDTEVAVSAAEKFYADGMARLAPYIANLKALTGDGRFGQQIENAFSALLGHMSGPITTPQAGERHGSLPNPGASAVVEDHPGA